MSTPNPGTHAATSAGCTCPVIDNNHGQFPVRRDEAGRDRWWIAGGCLVHDRSGPETAPAGKEADGD